MTKSASELVRDAQAQIESVESRQAFDELSSQKAVALDVREPFEWEEHIEGALQIPRGVLEFAADPTSSAHNSGLNPDRRVIVYCQSGSRGALAALTLKTLGFKHFANLEGGFSAWKTAQLPISEHNGEL